MAVFRTVTDDSFNVRNVDRVPFVLIPKPDLSTWVSSNHVTKRQFFNFVAHCSGVYCRAEPVLCEETLQFHLRFVTRTWGIVCRNEVLNSSATCVHSIDVTFVLHQIFVTFATQSSAEPLTSIMLNMSVMTPHVRS